MADYEFRYELYQAPEARLDGSGTVAHQIRAVYRLEGSSDDWQALSTHNKTALLDCDALITALSTGTNNQKVIAYKDLVAVALGLVGVPSSPPIAWDQDSLEAFMDANDVAIDAAIDADEFITVDLGQSYPVRFVL